MIGRTVSHYEVRAKLALLKPGGRMSIGLTLSPDGRWLSFAQWDTLDANLITVDGFD